MIQALDYCTAGKMLSKAATNLSNVTCPVTDWAINYNAN